MIRPRVILFFATIATAGCGNTLSWRPKVPSGRSYRYDALGYRAGEAAVVASSGAGLNFASVSAGKSESDTRAELGEKDPFAQHAAIDGVRFNEHLTGQGVRLLPTEVGSETSPSQQPTEQKL